jgi:hypothetical protein
MAGARQKGWVAEQWAHAEWSSCRLASFLADAPAELLGKVVYVREHQIGL